MEKTFSIMGGKLSRNKSPLMKTSMTTTKLLNLKSNGDLIYTEREKILINKIMQLKKEKDSLIQLIRQTDLANKESINNLKKEIKNITSIIADIFPSIEGYLKEDKRREIEAILKSKNQMSTISVSQIPKQEKIEIQCNIIDTKSLIKLTMMNNKLMRKMAEKDKMFQEIQAENQTFLTFSNSLLSNEILNMKDSSGNKDIINKNLIITPSFINCINNSKAIISEDLEIKSMSIKESQFIN